MSEIRGGFSPDQLTTKPDVPSRLERYRRKASFTKDALWPKAQETTVPQELLEMFAEREQEIVDLYRNVEFWHGRGKKINKRRKVVNAGQEEAVGEVEDVLDRMIDQGGFTPAFDNFDRPVGAQHSISLSPYRMYADAYARMNIQEGDEPAYLYLSQDYWFKRFIVGSLKQRGTVEDTIRFQINKRRQGGQDNGIQSPQFNFKGDYQNWLSKVRLEVPPEAMSILYARSDIPGNFPMLFGVREGAVTPSPTGKIIGKYETRTRDPLPIKGLTHVEVPLNHVAEVEQRLRDAGTDLKVLPLELGEVYASKFMPDELVHWNPFRGHAPYRGNATVEGTSQLVRDIDKTAS